MIPESAGEITENNPEKWYAPIFKLKYALGELLAHIIIVISILFGFWVIEKILNKLWGEGEHQRLLFDQLKLSYVFDAADLMVLIWFLFYGGYCLMVAYARKD